MTSIGKNFPPVGAGQKVAANIKEEEAKKRLAISWAKTTAQIGEEVVITGKADLPAELAAKITVRILCNNNPYDFAEKVSVNNGQFIAKWNAKAAQTKDIGAGRYDAEVRCGGESAKTATPLRLVPKSSNFEVSAYDTAQKRSGQRNQGDSFE